MKPIDFFKKFSKSGIVSASIAGFKGSRTLNAVAALAMIGALATTYLSTNGSANAVSAEKSLETEICLAEFFDVKRTIDGKPVALMRSDVFENAVFVAAILDPNDNKHPVFNEVRALKTRALEFEKDIRNKDILSDDFLRAVVEIENINRQLDTVVDAVIAVYGNEGQRLISSCLSQVAQLDATKLAGYAPTATELFNGEAEPYPFEPSAIDNWFESRKNTTMQMLQAK